MKLIGLIIKNIKTLIPYFLLITLYFFFINLETIEEQKNKSIIKSGSRVNEKESSLDDKEQIRISIPVFPYRE
tara:strand:- start:331 stop:549 length:219 start_codon:yes stop_codon:yes gene_type:complete